MRKVGHVVRDSKARSATRKIDSEENSEAAKDNCETELEKPKRPLQSFFVFTHEMRESSSKKLRLSEIAAKYNALSVDERSIYTNKAKENTERYRYVVRHLCAYTSELFSPSLINSIYYYFTGMNF